jgi:hypothetical protein
VHPISRRDEMMSRASSYGQHLVEAAHSSGQTKSYGRRGRQERECDQRCRVTQNELRWKPPRRRATIECPPPLRMPDAERSSSRRPYGHGKAIGLRLPYSDVRKPNLAHEISSVMKDVSAQ